MKNLLYNNLCIRKVVKQQTGYDDYPMLIILKHSHP